MQLFVIRSDQAEEVETKLYYCVSVERDAAFLIRL